MPMTWLEAISLPPAPLVHMPAMDPGPDAGTAWLEAIAGRGPAMASSHARSRAAVDVAAVRQGGRHGPEDHDGEGVMDGQNLARANAWLAFHTAASLPRAFDVDLRRPPGPVVQLVPNSSAVYVLAPGTQLWHEDGRMTIAP